MMKRVLKILALLAICAGGLFFYLKNTSLVTGWLMLFQQNSTQSIMGWINKAESPALTTLFLSAFQAFAMPWKTTPRIAIASAAVFGFVPGLMIVVLGRLIALSLYYGIGRLLVGVGHKKENATVLAYGAVSCFVGSWSAPLALLCGIFSVKFWKVLLVSLPVQLLLLGFLAKFANIYSSIIPDWCGYVTYGAGIALLAAALIFRKK